MPLLIPTQVSLCAFNYAARVHRPVSLGGPHQSSVRRLVVSGFQVFFIFWFVSSNDFLRFSASTPLDCFVNGQEIEPALFFVVVADAAAAPALVWRLI